MLWPSKESSMRGKIVMTVNLTIGDGAFVQLQIQQALRGIDDDFLLVEVDLFDDLFDRGNEMLLGRTLDHVERAGGGGQRRDQRADRLAVDADYLETDDLILIILSVFQRGQGAVFDHKGSADPTKRLINVVEAAQLEQKLLLVALAGGDFIAGARAAQLQPDLPAGRQCF